MKKLISVSASLVLLCSGCALFKNQTTAQHVATIAKTAAYVGATEYMSSHPETRPAFVIARDQLATIEASDTVDLTLLLAIVNKLPVKELKSNQGAVIVTAATIVLSDYAGSLPADQLKDLKPVVKALREGLDLALK